MQNRKPWLSMAVSLAMTAFKPSVAYAVDPKSPKWGTGGKHGYAGLTKPKTSHAALKRLKRRTRHLRARSPK